MNLFDYKPTPQTLGPKRSIPYRYVMVMLLADHSTHVEFLQYVRRMQLFRSRIRRQTLVFVTYSFNFTAYEHRHFYMNNNMHHLFEHTNDRDLFLEHFKWFGFHSFIFTKQFPVTQECQSNAAIAVVYKWRPRIIARAEI